MTTPAVTRRIGILGGTFDPPHLAHLALAEEAREALGLSQVLFVPAGQPWQKAGRALSPAHVRLAMVERAVEGNPFFAADAREVHRAGPSYTVETIEEIAAETGAELWFMLSTEALAGFSTWHHPGRILALARLCVVPRNGAPAAAVARFVEERPGAADRIALLDHPRLAISSTMVRARVRAGRSIRYLVPDAVALMIAEHALYLADPASVAAHTDA